MSLSDCTSDNTSQSTNSESTGTSNESPEVTEPEEPQLSELAANGKKIFEINCNQCHYMSNEVMLGPGLAGITERLEKEWILKFIKNSQAVIQSGDAYAVELYEKYNQTIMPNYNGSEEDLEALYAYLEEAK